jgi:hypothetical protein
MLLNIALGLAVLIGDVEVVAWGLVPLDLGEKGEEGE